MEAPRVTQGDVDAAIKGETYTVLPNGRTTVCQLTLDNGFTVEGMSACVSIENFNAALGQKIARQNAESQVWHLLGFRLQDELAKQCLTKIEVLAALACKEVAEVNQPDEFYFDFNAICCAMKLLFPESHPVEEVINIEWADKVLASASPELIQLVKAAR